MSPDDRTPALSENGNVPNASFHKGLIWVYLNGRCNFTCDYCLDGRNAIPGRLTAHDDFLDRLREFQAKLGFSLILTGGEPLLSLDAIQAICLGFPAVPIGIQTNGALTQRVRDVIPLIKGSDWFSISFHDQTISDYRKLAAVSASIDRLLSAHVNVHVQFMCSPQNTPQMIEQAHLQKAKGCRTSIRRLFEHSPEKFLTWKDAMRSASSDAWAVPAFFGAPFTAFQPYRAAVVYLDGRLAFVCREEVTIGNLYSGYDVSLIQRYIGARCDSVCQCCSCLWVNQEWGFA